MASLAPPVTVAREVPPLYQAEMDAKERVLLRIKLTEMQAGNLRPQFGGWPVRPMAPGQNLGALRREYAIVASAPAPTPGTPGAPASGPAIPTATGKASGTARPGDQPAGPDPRVSSPEFETEPTPEPPTPEPAPGTEFKEPVAPIPPGKASRKLSPEEIARQQAVAELLGLSEMVRLYLKREITPEEYHRQRAELLNSMGQASDAEPPPGPGGQGLALNPPRSSPKAPPAIDPAVPTPTGKATGRPEPAVASHQQALYELAWLSKLVQLYQKDQITTDEYRQRRTELFSGKSVTEPPTWAAKQPTAGKPPVSNPEAEPVQPQATEPGTPVTEPFVPTPTGQATGRPVLVMGDKQQAMSELLQLSELLRRYLEDQITFDEYHQRRGEILSKP